MGYTPATAFLTVLILADTDSSIRADKVTAIRSDDVTMKTNLRGVEITFQSPARAPYFRFKSVALEFIHGCLNQNRVPFIIDSNVSSEREVAARLRTHREMLHPVEGVSSRSRRSNDPILLPINKQSGYRLHVLCVR